jgi:hypothetical protein
VLFHLTSPSFAAKISEFPDFSEKNDLLLLLEIKGSKKCGKSILKKILLILIKYNKAVSR